MSTAKKHPNRLPFAGILTRLDVASDKAPNGSNGRRVILTREGAVEALDSLIGMAVNFATDWTAHNRRQKCGIITGARIIVDEVHVEGYIFANDFPEFIEEMRKPGIRMGMSYDLIDVHVADRRESVYRLTQFTFTGAAVLLRDEAAYPGTHFEMMEASAEKFTGRLSMLEGSFKLLDEPA